MLALFVRARVKESEVWKKTRQDTWKDFLQVIAIHWKLLIYIALFMAGLQLTTHGTQDMYPTFLERYWHFGPSERASITAISMVGALVGGVLFGVLSDRWGRRRMIAESHGANAALVRRTERSVAVAKSKSWAPRPRKGVDYLSRDPLGHRIVGDVDRHQPASAVMEDNRP